MQARGRSMQFLQQLGDVLLDLFRSLSEILEPRKNHIDSVRIVPEFALGIEQRLWQLVIRREPYFELHL